MGLNLSNIYQRPYIRNNGQGYVRPKRDEEASSPQTQREEQASQNGRSKGLLYTERDEYSRNASPVEAQEWQKELYLNAQRSHRTEPPQEVRPARVNNSINIAQILKDFKNTEAAIGTPDELREEVDGYLELIERQVVKENPNTKLIKSNLKNASSILDNYISKTLDKDSKVVENWVDALFMQDINFRYDEDEVNPQFLVKFPQRAEKAEEPKTQTDEIQTEGVTQEIEENIDEGKVSGANPFNAEEKPQTKVYIPQDTELKSLFIQAKKLAYAKEPRKAIENFQKALARANEIGDTETQSKIFYEIGKIYDDYDYPAQALKSYHKSLKNTSDNNIKTRAHYSMAQIYDNVNQIEPALDHYYVSAAYGGESDNKAAQSTSLARMGNIFSDMYEDDAFEFLTTAKELADETDNHKVKGFVSSSLARAYERFGEPQEALKSYSEAVKNYTEAESPVKAAQNYLNAADIMLGFNSSNKARGLLNKAQKFAQEANDEVLLKEINSRLDRLAA